MTPLNLLRLPRFALDEVLKCLDPIELFILAQFSQKAFNVIHLSNSKKFILNCDSQSIITINTLYSLKIERNDSNWLEESAKWGWYREIQTKLNCLMFFDRKYTVLTFWKHPLSGKKELSLYLSNLFKCPIASIAFDTNVSVDWFVDFVEQVTQNQKEIQKVSISKTYNADLSVESFKKILNSFQNLEIVSNLYINCPLEEYFDYTFDRLPKCLQVRKATWFSKKNLFSIDNCELVDLTDSLLENEDLDEFLKLWKVGRYSNLKYLHIHGRRLTEKKPIGGLSKLSDLSSNTIRSKNIDGHYCKIQNGVTIQRDNGQKADILLVKDHGFHFQLFVHEASDALHNNMLAYLLYSKYGRYEQTSRVELF